MSAVSSCVVVVACVSCIGIQEFTMTTSQVSIHICCAAGVLNQSLTDFSPVFLFSYKSIKISRQWIPWCNVDHIGIGHHTSFTNTSQLTYIKLSPTFRPTSTDILSSLIQFSPIEYSPNQSTLVRHSGIYKMTDYEKLFGWGIQRISLNDPFD